MQALWDLVVAHQVELYFAILFAGFFALIADFLQPASRVRAVVRHVKNKMADRSIEGLRKRIVEMERYRDTVNIYLTSDRALYLHTLGIVLAVLICMCMAAMVLLVGQIAPVGRLELLALGVFAIGIVLGAYGLRLASLDTRPKISELLAKLDGEIAEMKQKLNARRR